MCRACEPQRLRRGGELCWAWYLDTKYRGGGVVAARKRSPERLGGEDGPEAQQHKNTTVLAL